MRPILYTPLLLLTACAAGLPWQDPLRYGLGVDVGASGDSVWHFDDGVLFPSPANAASYIVTRHAYSDFELRLDFYPVEQTNSGVFIRCEDPNSISPFDCYEINIWDQHANPESRTGAVVRLSPPLTIVQTEDRWNTMRILADGERLRVWINDTLTNDFKSSKLGSGQIALQYGGELGMVRFRNFRIRELR
ncbi:MAG: DUF1080 domain-containing protein [Gammaproteobacteria bacterium]|nr:DUF1080 domain-containing protein [Gammaproteobacteria bacterium]